MALKLFLLGTHRHPSTFTPAVTCARGSSRTAVVNEGSISTTLDAENIPFSQVEPPTSSYPTPCATNSSMTTTAAQGADPETVRAMGNHTKIAAANSTALYNNGQGASFEEVPDKEQPKPQSFEQQTPLQPLLIRVDGLDGLLPVFSPTQFSSISMAPCESNTSLFINSALPNKGTGKEVERRTEGPDILGGLCLSEGMDIPDKPISMSVARYHALFDPLVDYDPLIVYGAIDGVLLGKTSEESIELRDAVIWWTHPHLGLLWASLLEAIEDMWKNPPLESQLQTYYYNASASSKEAMLFYMASPQVLHKTGQILLAVTQILETMNRFVKGKKTHAYRLDPGHRNLRLMQYFTVPHLFQSES
ncbi:hypothetical protein DXG01_011221 [Tephrocybe rancida]|nr:hypothetical protein DXG01_011221 [Tephrocybe rancida]